MRTGTENYRDHEIQVVHNPPFWQANIYPENARAPMFNPVLTIRCKTKEEAFAEARRFIDGRKA